jgi:hypothetical protein
MFKQTRLVVEQGAMVAALILSLAVAAADPEAVRGFSGTLRSSRSRQASDVDDRISERFRRFLRQVVSDTAANVPVCIKGCRDAASQIGEHFVRNMDVEGTN